MKTFLAAFGATVLIGCVAVVAVIVGRRDDVLANGGRWSELTRTSAEGASEEMLQVVTKATYDSIKPGMTLAEVYMVVGRDGEELSSRLLDLPGGEVTEKLIQWTNANGSGMNVTVQNGKVIQKAQFGLK